MNKTELLGWLGSTLLALCGLPEAFQALSTGSSGLTWTFLGLWGGGEIVVLIYTLLKSRQVKLLPLIFNYGLNIVFISIIVWVKVNQ